MPESSRKRKYPKRNYHEDPSNALTRECLPGQPQTNPPTIRNEVEGVVLLDGNGASISYEVIRDRRLRNANETLTILPTEPFYTFNLNGICMWDYNKRNGYGEGTSIDYNIPRNKFTVNCEDGYSDTINKINSELELITRLPDGSLVNVPQKLHDNYKNGDEGTTELLPGSNLEMVMWFYQVVYTYEGGDYALRVVFKKDKMIILIFFRTKLLHYLKDGDSWHLTTLNYPTFVKFYSFPDRSNAEEYLRSANNEGARRNRVGGSLPSQPGLAEPSEYTFSDVVTLMTDKTSKKWIKPIFYNLPREQINDFHIMAEDYETSILEYDIEHGVYCTFRYQFIPNSNTNVIKIFEKIMVLKNDDEKLVKLEVDIFTKIIKISTLKDDYEFNYSELENGETPTRRTIEIVQNHNNMKYRYARETINDRWNDVWVEVIRIMNNRRR